MERAPFLNGSLFTERNGDETFSVPSDLYWSANEDGAGLFTIFSRYHWTVDEHRPNESEQTLDPELLSNIFEQLITPTETGENLPERQPRGTYYTPADVVFEMVKDALSAAVASHAPPRMDESALLDLFGGRLARPPDLSESERTKLVERIRGIRVFDPAVGSGAFLFGALTAIKTALENLSEGDGAELTTDIRIRADTPDARSIDRRCPNSPKPVISTAARTPASAMTSAAARLSTAMTSTARPANGGGAAPCLTAAAATPVPRGLVRTTASPGRAAELAVIRSGATRPVTANP